MPAPTPGIALHPRCPLSVDHNRPDINNSIYADNCFPVMRAVMRHEDDWRQWPAGVRRDEPKGYFAAIAEALAGSKRDMRLTTGHVLQGRCQILVGDTYGRVGHGRAVPRPPQTGYGHSQP